MFKLPRVRPVSPLHRVNRMGGVPLKVCGFAARVSRPRRLIPVLLTLAVAAGLIICEKVSAAARSFVKDSDFAAFTSAYEPL